MSGLCPASKGVLVVSVDVGSGVVPANRVVGVAHGVPVSEGLGVVLVNNDINAVHGVLVVPSDVGSGMVIGAVCDIPVDTGTNTVPVGREVGGSQRPLSIMTDLCPAPKLWLA